MREITVYQSRDNVNHDCKEKAQLHELGLDMVETFHNLGIKEPIGPRQMGIVLANQFEKFAPHFAKMRNHFAKIKEKATKANKVQG